VKNATKNVSSATTRERIVAAALDLFARQGFAGTSMRQIATAVGIRAASLYNHFPGKEGLFDAIIESYGPASSASRLATPDYRALRNDPAAFCSRYIADLLEQWCDPDEQRFMMLLNAHREDGVADREHFLETMFVREAGLLTDYFRGFALKGLISTIDPKECARLFMAGLTLVRLEHFLMPPKPSRRGKVVEALDRFLEHFLALTAPQRGD
jgi:AcrR family transcriptional regulator